MSFDDKNVISLNEGNGGEEMQSLLSSFLKDFYRGDKWKNSENDSATLKLPNGDFLVFTTDSFVVNPIEFPNTNIGHLAVCGTINDLVVMGADVLGLSLGIIVEEGFEKSKLKRIIESINNVSKEYKIPVVTGDTKVMEKGSIDKIVINVSGVGIAKEVLDKPIKKGDKIILSGGIGEHGVALLSQRFDFETSIVSDSKPLVNEMREIRNFVKIAKDPTRGGLSSTLNEIAEQNKLEIEIIDKEVKVKREVKSAVEIFGLDYYELANEGKVVVVVSPENEKKVLDVLKKYNELASVIGEVKEVNKKGKVVLKTDFGSRILEVPSGRIVPRIC